MTYLLAQASAHRIPLRDESVQTCVTSPPYWALRQYSGEQGVKWSDGTTHPLGLEPTPDLFVAHMVEVFREVWRVLRKDGTLWLNLGDSYASGAMGFGNRGGSYESERDWGDVPRQKRDIPHGLKPKDLVGIPWRVALALQADGWYLRSDIIWSKPNPMPESVTDRPTKAHEYVFLLAKGEWKPRVVQFADLPRNLSHFGADSGGADPAMRAASLCVGLATTIFDLAQREHEFGLPSLDSQVWQESPDGGDGTFVRGLPVEHRAAVWAARLLSMRTSPERFMQELDRLGCDLTDRNHLLVGGVQSALPLPPSIHRNADGTIAINHAGKVCKVDFAHKRIVVPCPTTCTYYYDADAVREPHTEGTHSRGGVKRGETGDFREAGAAAKRGGWNDLPPSENPLGRNMRTVWQIATQPYPGAHFATFPEALPERCIKAGSAAQACGVCGAPWERVTERSSGYSGVRADASVYTGQAYEHAQSAPRGPKRNFGEVSTVTTGFRPTCAHDDGSSSSVVLDPFNGSGTTGRVALSLGRRYVGLDMSREYLTEQAIARIDPITHTHRTTDQMALPL